MRIANLISAWYRIGDAGAPVIIPDVHHIEWTISRAIYSPPSSAVQPGSGSASGSLFTFDPNVAEALFDLTPGWSISDVQLLAAYEKRDPAVGGVEVKRFYPVFFCSSGAKMSTFAGKEDDTKDPLHEIPFTIAMNVADAIASHIVNDVTPVPPTPPGA